MILRCTVTALSWLPENQDKVYSGSLPLHTFFMIINNEQKFVNMDLDGVREKQPFHSENEKYLWREKKQNKIIFNQNMLFHTFSYVLPLNPFKLDLKMTTSWSRRNVVFLCLF